MMGRRPGSQAGGMGGGTTEAAPWMGVVHIKQFPTQHGSSYFFGQEMEDRVKSEMYGDPTTCWEHCAQLGGCGLSAAAWQLLPAHCPEHSLSGWILAIAPAAQPSCNARGRICFAFAKNYYAMEGSV